MIKRTVLDGAAVLGVALVLSACTGAKDVTEDTSDSGVDTADTGEDTDSGIDTADTGETPVGDAVLLGRVTDAAGAAIEGASVTLDSGDTTQTDANGGFRVENLGTGADEEIVRAIATFSKDGFMGTTRIFDNLDATERTWRVSMIPRAAGQTFDTAAVDDVRLELGVDGGLTISPGTLVDEDGAAATGQATAYLTMINVDDDTALRAAPGDFSAKLDDGSEGFLDSWGMAELLILGADGRELQLAAGTTAEVEMPIVFPRIGREPNPGELIGFFWFDEATGQWMQDGEATNGNNGMFIGEIDRFDHWNSDKVMETTCVSAHVEDAAGLAQENLQVVAMGIDYTNYTDHFTDASGDAYMLVRRDSTLSFTVLDASGAELATMTASTPNTIGDCQSLLDAGQLSEVAFFTL